MLTFKHGRLLKPSIWDQPRTTTFATHVFSVQPVWGGNITDEVSEHVGASLSGIRVGDGDVVRGDRGVDSACGSIELEERDVWSRGHPSVSRFPVSDHRGELGSSVGLLGDLLSTSHEVVAHPSSVGSDCVVVEGDSNVLGKLSLVVTDRGGEFGSQVGVDVVSESLTHESKGGTLSQIVQSRALSDGCNGGDISSKHQPEEESDDTVIDKHVSVVDSVIGSDHVLQIAAISMGRGESSLLVVVFSNVLPERLEEVFTLLRERRA